jgi:hypothetical protein
LHILLSKICLRKYFFVRIYDNRIFPRSSKVPKESSLNESAAKVMLPVLFADSPVITGTINYISINWSKISSLLHFSLFYVEATCA